VEIHTFGREQVFGVALRWGRKEESTWCQMHWILASRTPIKDLQAIVERDPDLELNTIYQRGRSSNFA